MKRRNLLLIDGHNFLFKAFAVPFQFHSPKGTPLHVTTTFLSLVRRAMRALEAGGGCHFAAVTFDLEGPTSNHLLSPTYKANRVYDYADDEDSPFRHLPIIKKTLRYLKIKTFEKRGVEADDIIASLATRFIDDARSNHAYIASTDSDFYQILGPRVRQLVFTPKQNHAFIAPRDIIEKLGVKPSQYVLYKSLVGDKSDNIPGIPSIGPKRARDIVARVQPFDLSAHREILERNRKLITLNTDIRVCRSFRPLTAGEKIFTLRNQELFAKLGL